MRAWEIKQGDWIEVLRTMPDESVHCVVTSPPYWGLRDYGVPGQLGLERTPELYVAKMVEGFREVRRVLRKDGTLWLNLGDSYCSQPNQRVQKPEGRNDVAGWKQATNLGSLTQGSSYVPGLKPKDLIGVPWSVALALRSDGWYLRQDIIWSKPNPMPESVRDRCTKAHEYIFLLSKSERYWYDGDAIAEALAYSSIERLSQPTLDQQQGSDRVPGKTNGNMKAVLPRCYNGSSFTRGKTAEPRANVGQGDRNELTGRNKRSVWTVTTKPFSEAHFATFPPEIPETCIKAGCPEGGTVLDPFSGAGTTGLMATRLNRNFIGIELNRDYIEMASRRIEQDAPLFNIAQNEASEECH